jgi:hypothetical protein
MFINIGISNDLWSWPKKARSYKQQSGHERDPSGGETSNLTTQQAIISLRKLLAMRNELLLTPRISDDLRKNTNGHV